MSERLYKEDEDGIELWMTPLTNKEVAKLIGRPKLSKVNPGSAGRQWGWYNFESLIEKYRTGLIAVHNGATISSQLPRRIGILQKYGILLRKKDLIKGRRSWLTPKAVAHMGLKEI